MDAIAMEGRQGTARTVPEGFESGSDVATMCLLGYDPAVYHTGRAPLEAAAQHIPLSPSDWVFRCNLVTVIDGIMRGMASAPPSTMISEQTLARMGLLMKVSTNMQDLFRQGAFQGNAPRDAYFVRCDADTTTQYDIDRGIVNIVVGFAPLKPAEFVVISIQQKVASAAA